MVFGGLNTLEKLTVSNRKVIGGFNPEFHESANPLPSSGFPSQTGMRVFLHKPIDADPILTAGDVLRAVKRRIASPSHDLVRQCQMIC
jgi:hypothetical protein